MVADEVIAEVRNYAHWAGRALGVTDPTGATNLLIDAYESRENSYHNLNHIRHMLIVASWQVVRCPRVPELVWAILFHDAVYDPQAGDNEFLSAEMAIRCLDQPHSSAGVVVRGLILSTQKHVPFDPSLESKLMLDADLAVLGVHPDGYDRYANAIRNEYAFVPDEQYRAGRSAVLESFLSRPRIYLTTPCHRQREVRARRNLTTEIERLRSSL